MRNAELDAEDIGELEIGVVLDAKLNTVYDLSEAVCVFSFRTYLTTQ
jgi:hypothetical protein